jgi:hypothetical protein
MRTELLDQTPKGAVSAPTGWPRSSLAIAGLTAASGLLIWHPMLSGWWYLIDWHTWPYMIRADHVLDWGKFRDFLDPPAFHFGSKVTRPGYYLTTGAFAFVFRDQPLWWFAATLALFGIGTFSITAFIGRLAGPIFGLLFGAFLLLHPMWSDIVLDLTSELFAFVGLSVGAFLAQQSALRQSSTKHAPITACLAICSGAYGVCSKENVALSAVVCLPMIGLAILVCSKETAVRLRWILIGWWSASLVMLGGILHGLLIGRVGGKTVDLYDREISISVVLGSFLNWKIFWLPLFGLFLIATVTLAFLVFQNRSQILSARDVSDRFPLCIYAGLISAAGTACALVNVACYREVIGGRYLFPLALLPWLVCAGLVWALYRPFPALRRGFGFVPAIVASLFATGLAWPKGASASNNFKSAARFVRHTSFIRSTVEAARDRCLGKPHPIVVLLSHDFNDLEPVLAVNILLDYLNVLGPRYFLRDGYSLESAENNGQRYLWKTMEEALESGLLKRASKDDLVKADFVIQFSAPENTKQSVPNLWPLYLHQD